MGRKIKFVNDKASTDWMATLTGETRSSYGVAWRYFLEYTGMTGDEVLANRKRDSEYKWEQKTITFRKWMIEEKQKSENTAKTTAAAVRGFFGFYRLPLVFRRQEARQLTSARRKTEDYKFSREDLQRMVDFANLTERYVILAGKSFGLRAGDFAALKRGDLEPYIDREPPISIGEYATEKEDVVAFPFIDSDAQPVIKLMLEQMTREGRTNPNDRVLAYKDEIQLTRILERVAKRAGINYGTKNVRFHCLRKFLCDHLASHMSTEKWKQIVGKTISEGAYISADSLREDYKRAMAETTLARASAGDIDKRAKILTLETLAKLAGLTDNEIQEYIKREAFADLEKAIKARQQPQNTASNNCTDGEHCQRVVSEDELEPLLAQGFRVAAVLPSGKIVVEN